MADATRDTPVETLQDVDRVPTTRRGPPGRPAAARRRANLLTFAIAVVAGMLISIFGVGTVRVSGTSMQPNLHDGDHALVLRFDAWLHRAGLGNYQPGDVVFFPDPSVPRTGLARLWLDRHLLIKRIAAGAGQRVSVRDGVLYVDGAPRPEPYLQGAYLGRSSTPATQLPQGEVYVLGDNRAPLASLDSRSFGPLDSRSLEGRAVAVFWPLFRRTPSGWRWNPHLLRGRSLVASAP